MKLGAIRLTAIIRTSKGKEFIQIRVNTKPLKPLNRKNQIYVALIRIILMQLLFGVFTYTVFRTI